MRIDRFLSEAGVFSRREAGKAAKSGLIRVNGETVRDLSRHIDPQKDEVRFRGEVVSLPGLVYLMLNKPAGVVSSTDDPRDKTVLDLIPASYRNAGLFPCGRLDKDTVGLVILTNDGKSAHRLLSPRRHAEKEYRFETADPLGDTAAMEGGMTLADGTETKPCRIVRTGERAGLITLTEGKYHEIRRMFGAAGNRVTFLERISFAGIRLDPSLARGDWRPLTAEEILLFTQPQGAETEEADDQADDLE